MHTLWGLHKTEQLGKRSATIVHPNCNRDLKGDDELILEKVSGYTMISSERQDKTNMEGVGLALTPNARPTIQCHHAVSSRVLAAEFLTKGGPLLIVVAYTPTDQDCTEDKDHFYSDLDHAKSNGNGLARVMGNCNTSVSERVMRVVGPYD